MPACGYEFYLLVFNSISHSYAALTRELSSSTLEDKIHIQAQARNILYILTPGVTSCETNIFFILLILGAKDSEKGVTRTLYHQEIHKGTENSRI